MHNLETGIPGSENSEISNQESEDLSVLSQELDTQKNKDELDAIENGVLVKNIASKIDPHELKKITQGVEMSDGVKNISEKIFSKLLESKHIIYGVDQSELEGKNVDEYFQGILKEHPELWSVVNLELQVGNLECKLYDDCTAFEKIKLISMVNALQENWLYNPHLNDDGSYDIKDLDTMFKYALEGTVEDLAGVFKWKQVTNFGQIDDTLREDFGLSEDEITQYSKYLEEVKKYIEAHPDVVEANAYGYLAAFIAGVLATALGIMIYKNLMNPDSMKVITQEKIKLTGLEDIAKLVVGEGGFEVTKGVDQSMFDETSDDGRLKKNAKKIANAFQSKELIMQMDGKVGVEFDLTEESGTEYFYNPETQMVEITLAAPEFKIRETNSEVIYKNGEVFEMDIFDNTEIDLEQSMREGALDSEELIEPLYNLALQNVSKIFYKFYDPVFDSELTRPEFALKGVKVTVAGSTRSYDGGALDGPVKRDIPDDVSIYMENDE